MTDISFAVQSILLAFVMAAGTLHPKGRMETALRVSFAFIAVYFAIHLFRDVPIRVPIDPVAGHWLNKSANLVAIAAVIWTLVNSFKRAAGDPAQG